MYKSTTTTPRMGFGSLCLNLLLILEQTLSMPIGALKLRLVRLNVLHDTISMLCASVGVVQCLLSFGTMDGHV